MNKIRCEFCNDRFDFEELSLVNNKKNFICRSCKKKYDLFWLFKDGKAKFFVKEDKIHIEHNPDIWFFIYLISFDKYFPDRKYYYFKWRNELWRGCTLTWEIRRSKVKNWMTLKEDWTIEYIEELIKWS